MAKTRIKGTLGHQGGYDPAGVDPEMKRTLMGGDDPAPPKPAAARKPSVFEQVGKAIGRAINSTGSNTSPTTVKDAPAVRVRSDAQVRADYDREKAARRK